MTSKYAPTAEELEFAQQSMPIPKAKVMQSTSKYAPTTEEMEFAQQSASMPEQEDLSSFKSYLYAAGRGITKGLADIRDLAVQQLAPGGFEEGGKEIGNIYGFSTLKPEEKKHPKPSTLEQREELEEELEKRLPTNEGKAEEVIERGGRIATTAITGAGGLGGKALRTGIAAGSGQLAKELGAGETVQTLAESLAFVAPDLTKALIGSTYKQKELISFGKKRGLKDKELVPGIIEKNKFRKSLARFASRGEKTQEALEESRKAIGEIYDSLKTSPGASSRIPKDQIEPIIKKYAKEWYALPVPLRKQIKTEIDELLKSKGTGEDFIRFYQHVNYATSDPKRLGKFQEVTREALEHINPELGHEFRLTNELASNRYKTAHILRPPSEPDVLPIVKGAAAAWGVFSGDYSMLKSVLGYMGAKKVATAMLLNPRYQNLGTKTVNALNQNNIHLASQYFKELRENLQEDAPEFYEDTKDFDIKTLNPNSTSNKAQR